MRQIIYAIFGVSTRQVGHPWAGQPDTKPDNRIATLVTESDTTKVTWGKSREVKAVVKEDEKLSMIDWDLTTNKAQRAVMPDEMTDYDFSVIKRKNVDQHLYEQIRPYIIQGKTNAEISGILGCSKSKIDSTCARVREAIRNYQKAPPPTIR